MIAVNWRLENGLMWRFGMSAALKARAAGDPAALLLAGPTKVRDLFVEGRQVVRDGQMATIDLPRVIEQQNRLAKGLMQG